MDFSDWTITDKGLEIKCTKEQSDDLKELVNDKSIIEAEGEVLEHAVCNGLQYTLPEDIGALTSATLLTDGDELYSDFKYYQIRSFVEDLIDNQECILHKIN